MSSYRFCRTDDVSLLVDALNRCWSPYFPDEPAVTPASFKRSIRDRQVWCSTCMVAFGGPIRSSAAMLRRIRVFRVETAYLRGRCALLMAIGGHASDRFISIARGDARCIRRAGMRWSDAIAMLVDAGAAYLSSPPGLSSRAEVGPFWPLPRERAS